MLYVGIDPDIQNISAAVLEDQSNDLIIYYSKAPKIKAPQEERVTNTSGDILAVVEEMEGELFADTFVCVEGQDIRYSGRTNKVPPQSLIGTAQISGMWCGAIYRSQLNLQRVQIVLPFTWKRTTAKVTCQGRAYDALGIPYHVMGGKTPYAVPDDIESLLSTGSDKPNPGDFIDISDSVALALYCRRKYGK